MTLLSVNLWGYSGLPLSRLPCFNPLMKSHLTRRGRLPVKRELSVATSHFLVLLCCRMCHKPARIQSSPLALFSVAQSILLHQHLSLFLRISATRKMSAIFGTFVWNDTTVSFPFEQTDLQLTPDMVWRKVAEEKVRLLSYGLLALTEKQICRSFLAFFFFCLKIIVPASCGAHHLQEGPKRFGCQEFWVAAKGRDLGGLILKLQKLALGMWNATSLKEKGPMRG